MPFSCGSYMEVERVMVITQYGVSSRLPVDQKDGVFETQPGENICLLFNGFISEWWLNTDHTPTQFSVTPADKTSSQVQVGQSFVGNHMMSLTIMDQ